MDFNLDRLRAFIVVARMGNLSAAAKELGTTQPNLGRQMTALEKEVRLTLFVRHSRGLALTKQGEEFRLACQDIVFKISQISDIIREKESKPEGTLKVISGSGILERILEKIQSFSKKFPDINFFFSSVTDIYQLKIGDSDVALMIEPINDSDFIQLPLYDMILRVYASPAYLKSYGTPMTINDLKPHKIILYGGENSKILNNPLTNEIMNDPKKFIVVTNGPSMKAALVNGCGIGCYGYDRKDVENNLLVDVFPDMPDQIISYYFTYHRRLEGSPKIKVFYDFLKEEIVKGWDRPESHNNP